MPDLVIEPTKLNSLIEENTADLIIIDLGKEERFLNAHIPGARLVTPAQTQAGPPIPGFAPSDQELSQLMQRIGLTPNSYLVVYDDEGGGWAGRFIWLLDEIGHTNYSYLNGGIHAWAAADLPLESGMTQNTPSSIDVSNSGANSITKSEILELLETNSVQVWDARSPLEHSGQTAYAARGGRIPGALNYEWTRAMDQANAMRFKPIDVLKSELADAGIDPAKPTITHCQTHHRSGLTYLLGKVLNFKEIKAYPGSWGEWGNSNDTPIETD